MRRCIAISATVLFLAQVSSARLSSEPGSGPELLQQVKQALRAPGKAWARWARLREWLWGIR